MPDETPKTPDSSAEAALKAAKRAARAQARHARDSVAQGERRAAAQELAHLLLGLPELEKVSSILVFAALPEEIDPLSAVWRLRKRGVRIAYPRIESPGVLDIHYVDHELELVPGPFALAQPSEHASRAPHIEIDAVIVPGVAFDESGRRLGYGGGYYDRLLPQMRPDCARIGIAFEEQILAEVPTGENDAHVDIVVTPARIIRPAAPKM